MSTPAVQLPQAPALNGNNLGLIANLKSSASKTLDSLASMTVSSTNGQTNATSGNSLRLAAHSSPLPAIKTPYVLEPDQGETHTIIGSGSIMRYLATAKVTAPLTSSDTEEEQVIGASPEEGGFAVVQTRARQDEPVPAQ